MQALYDQYHRYLELVPMEFFREQHETINWDCRVIGILGPNLSFTKIQMFLEHLLDLLSVDSSISNFNRFSSSTKSS